MVLLFKPSRFFSTQYFFGHSLRRGGRRSGFSLQSFCSVITPQKGFSLQSLMQTSSLTVDAYALILARFHYRFKFYVRRACLKLYDKMFLPSGLGANFPKKP